MMLVSSTSSAIAVENRYRGLNDSYRGRTKIEPKATDSNLMVLMMLMMMVMVMVMVTVMVMMMMMMRMVMMTGTCLGSTYRANSATIVL